MKIEQRNLKALMEEKIPRRVLRVLRTAGEVAEGMGSSTYLVGGLVRDLLLGVENLDVDITVEGDGIAFAKKLAQRLSGRVKGQTRFGTAIVTFRGGFKIDVATARQEYYERPAALPTVQKSSLRDDQFRRDFTINAMAIKLNPGEFGKLIDFFGGERDLKRGVVRTLHHGSFLDDPTRIFRAVRFSERYQFEIDEGTKDLIKQATNLAMFDALTIERVRDELVLILSEKKPVRAIRRMAELHELKFIHPGIKLNKQLRNLLGNLEELLNWFRSSFPKEKCEQWLIYFSALLQGLTVKEARAACQRFHLSRKDEEKVIKGKEGASRKLRELGRVRLRPSQIYGQLEKLPLESLLVVMAGAGKIARGRIALYLRELRSIRLKVTGDDLKELGLKPGPVFTKLLEKTLIAKLDGSLKTKRDELNHVKMNVSKRKKRDSSFSD